MAAVPSELAESLSQDEIPIKLRCASCNKLVLNAFRLPCCDQNICENCQQTLPESCPVCMHTPLSGDDCKPNKALRLTVKAFLKNEEKKRAKEQAATVAPTAADPASTSTVSDPPVALASVNTPVPSIEPVSNNDSNAVQTGQAEKDAKIALEAAPKPETAPSSPSSSIEITLEAPEEVETNATQKGFGRPSLSAQNSFSQHPSSRPDSQVGHHHGQQNDLQITNASEQYDQPSQSQQQDQMANGMGYGFGAMNGMGISGMNGMPMTGNFGSMMDMQNSMNAMNFAGFPNMISMPGMGMDFMSMAPGMFAGTNGQNMGMNGMNTMNGMNGMSNFNGMGMGFNGGFNGWDGSSAMGMSGGMGGNFGANAGYYPSGGYNQQMHQANFSQMNQPQFQMNNHRQNHFNRSGRYGGYNRDRGRNSGQWQQRHPHGSTSSQGTSAAPQWREMHNSPHETPKGTDPSQVEDTSLGSVEQANESQQAPDSTLEAEVVPTQLDTARSDAAQPKLEESTATQKALDLSVEHQDSTEQLNHDLESGKKESGGQSYHEDIIEQEFHSKPQPITAIDTSRESIPTVNVSNSAFSDVQEPILNAPRGPAAQFQLNGNFAVRGSGAARGFNRGTFDMRGGRFRGRGPGRYGYFVGQRYGANDHFSTAAPEPIGQGVEGAPTGPKAMRQGVATTRGRGSDHDVGNADRAAGKSTPDEQAQATVNQPAAGDADENIDRDLGHARPRSRSRARSASSHRHKPRSRSRSHHRRLEGYDTNPEPPVEDQPAGWRDAEKGAENDFNEGYADDGRGRNPSTEPSSRRHGRREKDRHRSSRHSREQSRDRKKGRRRSRSRGHDESSTYIMNGKGKRSRDHRSRSPDRDRDRDRDRGRDRELHRDDRHRRRSSREDQARGEPTLAQHEFKIKDRSKRTDLEVQKDLVRRENPDMDSHTLEREARNRERLLKEQQRREGLAGGGRDSGGTSRKRGIGAVHNNDIDYKPTSRRRNKDRRLSYHYEGEESDEARAMRVENEREAARWH